MIDKGSRRVAILHGSNDTYGASRVLLDDVGILRSLGWATDVLLPHEGPLTALLSDAGARVEVHPLHVLRRVTLTRTRVPLKLPASIAAADLVVLWTLALALYLPALALRRKARLCSVHEIQPGSAGTLLARFVARGSHGLMVNSQATAAWLCASAGKAVDPVVAYPVAPPFQPMDMPASDSPLQILLAGRVNGNKGHIEAVHACRLARAGGLDLRLTLLGSPYPGQEAHLHALQHEIAHEDWVAFPGQVDSIQPYLAQAHVLLVPSTTPEPFGIVALEGWAAGRSVIASDIGGLAEAANLVGAIKVPPGDVGALASALLEVAPGGGVIGSRASAVGIEACSIAYRRAAWEELLARSERE